MKYIITITILITTISFAQSTKGYDIVINMTNFDSNDGKVMVGLFDSEANWLEKSINGDVGKIDNRTCTVVLKNIPVGIYAISVYHDENDNNELDSNFLGLPKEDYASSNNAPARFGPPEWKDAKFEVKNGGVIQNIKL